jgi:hypothetical protein
MTINYEIATIQTHNPFHREKDKYREEIPKDITTTIGWVSHGNYALKQGSAYIHIEEEYFDEILYIEEAFDNEHTNEHINDFTPFWSAVLPMRGLSCFPKQLSAYFTHEHDIILEQRLSFDGFPTMHCIEQMCFTVEDFKKIRDLALNGKHKPLHYCQDGSITFDRGTFEK